MRFKTTLCALLCFFLCLCNGAPGGENKKKHEPRGKYTDEENKLVIEEVAKLLGDYKGVSNTAMWEKVADKHLEKFRQSATGFPQERSADTLRVHFQNIIKNYESQNEVILPKSLIQELNELNEFKMDRGITRIQNSSYSKQEDKIIFDELLKTSYGKIFSASIITPIQAKINQNHYDKVHGFDHERTYGSVRLHLRMLKNKGLFPSEIKRKFLLFDQGASSSDNTSQNQRTDVQLKKKPSSRRKYTKEENKFIVEEVKRLLHDHKSISSRGMWKKVEEKHLEKFSQKTSGFPKERSADCLRLHFLDALRNYQSRNRVVLPESLMQMMSVIDDDKLRRGITRISRSSYSAEEEKLICDELLNPSCERMFSSSTLNSIKAKLDKNHQEKIHGFECERTLAGIRLHLSVLRDKGQFPSEIIKKFSLLQKDVPDTSDDPSFSSLENFAGTSGSDILFHNQENDFQLADEGLHDDDWIAEMIEELRNK